MSGLLALLDDVAAIAKVAAASVDDIAGAAAKAGAKAAGVVIDDTAVTPRYIHGFEADRELPIVWRIARGSVRNKLLILLPALLLLEGLLPAAIPLLLMVGGAYLCFEGAEKVFHAVLPHGDAAVEADLDPGDPARLEEARVAGAIKTDFILSAEIMVIALTALPASGLVMQAVSLAVVGLAITFGVYGVVGLIVKMDDIGLHLARNARTAAARLAGRGLVRGMPPLLALLSAVGTAAMLWVGGNIVIHGIAEVGWPALYEGIHDLGERVAHAVPAPAAGLIGWLVTALCDGVLGLALGMVLIPVAGRVVVPLWAALTGGQRAEGH